MQHWDPADETPLAVEAPRDVWSAWLNRAPLHDVAPPPRQPRHWSGMVVTAALLVFWAVAGWQLLG